MPGDNAEQIAALAYVYGTEQLKEKCEQFLIDHRQPTMELMVVAENYEVGLIVGVFFLFSSQF